MRIAVVAGGWHFPWHFYWRMAQQASGCALFCIAHRSPDLPIVREEKVQPLCRATGPLADIDRMMYARRTTVEQLQSLGWDYSEAPNVCGDQCFLNQWLEKHDYREYDAILNCHDDTYVRRLDLFKQLAGDWLVLANSAHTVPGDPNTGAGYFRGSFEFWSREMLQLCGGRIDLGEVKFTREGKTDTPPARGALHEWNFTGFPVRAMLRERGLTDRVKALSPHYRVSPWIIEGERGFLHIQGKGPWSIEPGLKAYPL